MPYKDKEKQKEYFKKWYAENREKEIKSAIKRNRRNKSEKRKFVAEDKKLKGCCKCSEADPCCLDYHHIGDDKETEIATAIGIHGWGKKRLIEEIKKCVVICANCHRKLHAGKLAL
jgi:hypothetical protein